MQKKMAILIPAKNERESIIKVLKKLHVLKIRHNFKNMTIIVVDDSIDGTDYVAKTMGANAIKGNNSLGLAYCLGIKEALKYRPNIIISIDADGQFDPMEIPKLIRPLILNNADLVLGSRFLKRNSIKYKMPFTNKIGNTILTHIVKFLTGLQISDAQTGFRAMKKEVAVNLNIIGTHTYVQETIIDAKQKGYRILEVPVKFRKRKYGKSKVVSSTLKYAIMTLPPIIIHSIFGLKLNRGKK